MPVRTVHAVLAQQLGGTWRQRFRDFDDAPAAAASIGQVHRATWRDGRDVAVKIQYPGAATALMADLNQLARFARLFAALFPGMDVKPLIAELKARVVEELDYGLEADAQRAFAAAYAGDAADRRPAGGGQRPEGDRLGVARRHSAVADHRRRHPRAARPRRARCWRCCTSPARSGPGCCTPTRTRATSGCWTTAGSASSTSARPPGCPTAIPSRSAGCCAGRWPARPTRCSPTCASEGFVRPTSRSTRRACSTSCGRCSTRSPSRHFHFTRAWMQEQAARIADPRNEASRLGRQLNLPAGLPAHPPGDDRVDRRALPARRRRATSAASSRSGSPASSSDLRSSGSHRGRSRPRCAVGPRGRADLAVSARPGAASGPAGLGARPDPASPGRLALSRRRRWPARRGAPRAPRGGPRGGPGSSRRAREAASASACSLAHPAAGQFVLEHVHGSSFWMTVSAASERVAGRSVWTARSALTRRRPCGDVPAVACAR